jgi:hypothetical protein
MIKLPYLSNELTHSEEMTLGEEQFFSIQTHAPQPEVITGATTGSRTQAELVSPFRNRTKKGGVQVGRNFGIIDAELFLRS